jgi:phosphoglycerate kinase
MESIKNVDVKGKRVIVRVYFNVPIKDSNVVDDTRIVGALKTIKYLVDNNAKVILLSHIGRVESLEDKDKNTLRPVAKHLSTLIDTPIYFVPLTRGMLLEKTIENMNNGEIVVIENTRHEDYPKKLESSCDESLSKYWANLGDIFVLDAFGTAHRCHASTYGISKYIPSYAGFLVEEETKVMDEVINKNKTLILGGAKVDDKIGVINNLIKKSDRVLIGGAMCFTFLKAQGINVGSSIVSEDQLGYAEKLLEKYGSKIVLPVDVITKKGAKDIDKLGKKDVGYDIGPKTIKLFESMLDNAKMVLWNGPLGMYEEKEYEKGTKNIMKYLKTKKYKTILAGGDVVSAAKKFKVDLYYASTGGG